MPFAARHSNFLPLTRKTVLYLQTVLWVALFASSVASAATPTTTTFAITSNVGTVTSVSAGTVVTLTATVAAGSNPLTLGQINFCDATAPACTDIHLVATAQITSAGTAITRLVPAPGTHNYKAVFLGTTANGSSVSDVATLQVNGSAVTVPYPSATTITTEAGSGVFSVTGTVYGLISSTTPVTTGTLTFQDTSANNAIIATVPVTGVSGNLSALSTSSNCSVPNAVAATVGDFNNDGYVDVLITSSDFRDQTINAVTVCTGDGDGLLHSSIVTMVSNNLLTSFFSTVADLNRDGNLDFVTTDVFGNPVVYIGQGDGHFIENSPITSTKSQFGSYVAVGDVNGDGKLDLVVPNRNTGNIDLLYGNGDGTFAAPTSITTATTTFVVLGDFNGDGKLDIAALQPASLVDNDLPTDTFNIQMFTGDGAGSFLAASTAFVQGGCCEANSLMGAADLNGDGTLDLAVPTTHFTGSAVDGYQVQIYLNAGDASRREGGGSPIFTGTGYGGIAFGEFNGDGKLDLLLDGGTTSRLEINKGDGIFLAPVFVPGPITGPVADFNGDGVDDLQSDGQSSSNFSIALVRPSNTFSITQNDISVTGGGTHLIQAVYSGDANYKPSSSNLVSVNGVTATALSLTANPTTATVGIPVTLTATLSPFSLTNPSHTTDGYQVVFKANNVLLGSSRLSAGVAVLTTTALPLGLNTLQAYFATDGLLASSTSPEVSFAATGTATVNFAVPTHTYGNSPFMVSATSGSDGAFTYSVVSGPATISGAFVTLTGVGKVTLLASQAATSVFTANTASYTFTVLPATLTITANNTARVFGTSNSAFTGSVSGAVNNDTFTESFATTATAASIVGGYPIVPSVTGANLANYNINRVNGTLTIAQAGTATTFALSNQNTTLTAKVASLTTGMPTGTVTFLVGQNIVGNGTLDSTGTATYSASSAPTGNAVVSAQYSGDVNFTQSAAPPILLVSGSPDNASVSISQAGTATDKINFSSAPGYAGAVQLACANLPQNSTCSFQPSTIAFSPGSQTGSTTVTITTGITSQASLAAPSVRGTSGVLTAICAPGLFVLCFVRRKGAAHRIPRNILFSLLLLVCTATLITACGGSGSTTTNPNSSASPTTVGNYNITINANGSNGLTQSVPLVLNVHR